MSTTKSWNELFRQSNGDVTVQTVYLGSVPLTQFYNKTLRGDYVAKGVGMYSTGNGTIDLAGLVPSDAVIEKVFLYWSVFRNTNQESSIILNNTTITGNLLGTVSGYIAIEDAFRADVTGIANIGENTLVNPNNTINIFGAALVVVYSRNDLPCKTVIINDGIQLFTNETVSTSLQNFNAAGLPPQANTTYIVAGAYPGADYPDSAIFNGITVESPDAFSSAEGLFWDTLKKDVTGLVNTGDITATASIQTADGPIIWIAQVFSVTTSDCQGRGISFFSVS